MQTSRLQYLIGGLFALGFLAALLGLLFLSADTTAVVTVVAVTVGGLILLAVLPKLVEFSIGLKGVTAKLTQVEEKVEEQQKLINRLVETSMSLSAFRHLAGITILYEYKYWQDERVGELFRREYYYLKDRGFIGPETLEFFEGLNNTNMAGKAIPTEIGRIYITLRKDDIPKEWLSTDPDKRANLKTDVARELGLEVPEIG
jgi:hypothetical protein